MPKTETVWKDDQGNVYRIVDVPAFTVMKENPPGFAVAVIWHDMESVWLQKEDAVAHMRRAAEALGFKEMRAKKMENAE